MEVIFNIIRNLVSQMFKISKTLSELYSNNQQNQVTMFRYFINLSHKCIPVSVHTSGHVWGQFMFDLPARLSHAYHLKCRCYLI